MLPKCVIADIFQVTPSSINQSLKHRTLEKDIRIRTIRTLLPRTKSVSEDDVKNNFRNLVQHIKRVRKQRNQDSKIKGRKLARLDYKELMEIIYQAKNEVLQVTREYKVLGGYLRQSLSEKNSDKIRESFRKQRKEFHEQAIGPPFPVDAAEMDDINEGLFPDHVARRLGEDGKEIKIYESDDYPQCSEDEAVERHDPGVWFLGSDNQIYSVTWEDSEAKYVVIWVRN